MWCIGMFSHPVPSEARSRQNAKTPQLPLELVGCEKNSCIRVSERLMYSPAATLIGICKVPERLTYQGVKKTDVLGRQKDCMQGVRKTDLFSCRNSQTQKCQNDSCIRVLKRLMSQDVRKTVCRVSERLMDQVVRKTDVFFCRNSHRRMQCVRKTVLVCQID